MVLEYNRGHNLLKGQVVVVFCRTPLSRFESLNEWRPAALIRSGKNIRRTRRPENPNELSTANVTSDRALFRTSEYEGIRHKLSAALNPGPAAAFT